MFFLLGRKIETVDICSMSYTSFFGWSLLLFFAAMINKCFRSLAVMCGKGG